jgi:hypothetical protein
MVRATETKTVVMARGRVVVGKNKKGLLGVPR